MILWTVFLGFLVILFMGVPIGIALGASSAIVLYAFMKIPLIVVAQRMFTSVDSFSFIAVPFFMLAGAFMSYGGVTKRLVNFAHALVGALAGGLAFLAKGFIGWDAKAFPQTWDEVIARLPGIEDDVGLSEFLIEHGGVAVVPGSAFGTPGHIRLSIATSMANLEKALTRMAAALG